MTIEMPIVEYLCPACGNPYFGTAVGSYSTFRLTKFSDGSIMNDFSFNLWLTRCPKCRRFFAKKHLFKIPMTSRVAWFIRDDMQSEIDIKRTAEELGLDSELVSLIASTNYERQITRMYGNVDCSLDKDETSIEFFEKALEEKLYFPPDISDSEKQEINIELHKALWWEYNKNRQACDDQKYMNLCKKIIELLANRSENDEVLLTVAELYRNIGDFEQSTAVLKCVSLNSKTQSFVKCIEQQNKLRKEKTVVVEN